MIDRQKLSQALRARFKTPADALRALGLDASGALMESGERGGLSGDFAAQILDFLADKLNPQQMSEFGLFIEQLLSDAKVAANDDEAPGHAAFSDFLRNTGLGEQHVRKAVDMIPRAGRAADSRMTEST